jgi:outer membrane lipoprotein-sorting protein
MEKQKVLFGIIAPLVCSILIISGCTQQQGPDQTITESLQTILEKAAIVESVYYELATTTTMSGAPIQTTTMKIWQKTPYLKEEVNITAGNITTTLSVIKRPQGIYRYDPMLDSYEFDPLIILPQRSTTDIIEDLLNNQTITILGTETIDGKTATVIQYTPSQVGNSTTMKIWIWNEKGVPLKALITQTNEETTITMDYEYSNYSFADISDSTFSVE